jgi:hypothetical protein
VVLLNWCAVLISKHDSFEFIDLKIVLGGRLVIKIANLLEGLCLRDNLNCCRDEGFQSGSGRACQWTDVFGVLASQTVL